MTPPVPDTSTLSGMLRNSGWLRALALELLNDPSQADDVLQEVWMTAINNPPREREPRSQRSWLKKVLRTFALRANRSQRRRDRWEQQTPPKKAPPSPDEMIDRLEMQSRLAEAVRSLPDPYRSIVFLRFFENASPMDIARDQGVPASTVRTQLHRGLAMLRERLETEFNGDPRDLKAVLLLLVGPVPLALDLPLGESATADAGSAGSAEDSWAPDRFGLGAAAVLILAALLVGARYLPTSPEYSERSVASDPTRALRDAGSATATTAVRTQPSPNLQSATERVPPPTRADDAAIQTWPLVVLDHESGRPLDNAALFLVGADEATGDLIGRSDHAGSLSIPAAPFCRESIRVFRDGYMEYRESARLRTLENGPYVIRMTPCFIAYVSFVQPNGEPAAGVPVEIGPAAGVPDGYATEQTHTTDDGGTVHYIHQYIDTQVRVNVAPWATVTRRVESAESTVQLEVGRALHAIVRDAAGAPLADAFVSVESDRNRNAVSDLQTDSEGVLDLGRVATGDEFHLRVYPHDRPAISVRAIPPEDDEWIIDIPDGVVITGVIRGPDGSPLTDAVPFLVRRESAEETQTQAIPAIRTKGRASRRAAFRLKPYARGEVDADGSFSVGPVALDDELFVLVHHPRWVNRVIAVDATAPPLDITLSAGTPIHGIVRSPNGNPMAGVLLHVGERFSNDTESVLGRVRTDEHGAFTFSSSPSHAHDQIPGCFHSDGTQVTRETLFMTAFHPDSLLAKNGMPVWESSVYQSATFSPGESSIELIAASAPHSVELHMSMQSESGESLRAWTPTVWIDRQGTVHRGTLGFGQSVIRFHTDHTIGLEGRTRGTLAVFPLHYRWHVSEIGQESLSMIVERSGQATSITLVSESGQQVSHRNVAIGFGGTRLAPHSVIGIGASAESGVVLAPVAARGELPRGPVAVFVSRNPSPKLGVGELDVYDPERWIVSGIYDLSNASVSILVR